MKIRKRRKEEKQKNEEKKKLPFPYLSPLSYPFPSLTLSPPFLTPFSSPFTGNQIGEGTIHIKRPFPPFPFPFPTSLLPLPPSLPPSPSVVTHQRAALMSKSLPAGLSRAVTNSQLSGSTETKREVRAGVAGGCRQVNTGV